MAEQKIKTYLKVDAYSIMFKRIQANMYDGPERRSFRCDLFDAYKVNNNPKKILLYAIAVDLGRSGGRIEVLNYFDKLVDLIVED